MAALSTAVKMPARMPKKIRPTSPSPGSAETSRSSTACMPGNGSVP
jgi:hypothetical protein